MINFGASESSTLIKSDKSNINIFLIHHLIKCRSLLTLILMMKSIKYWGSNR